MRNYIKLSPPSKIKLITTAALDISLSQSHGGVPFRRSRNGDRSYGKLFTSWQQGDQSGSRFHYEVKFEEREIKIEFTIPGK